MRLQICGGAWMDRQVDRYPLAGSSDVGVEHATGVGRFGSHMPATRDVVRDQRVHELRLGPQLVRKVVPRAADEDAVCRRLDPDADR